MRAGGEEAGVLDDLRDGEALLASLFNRDGGAEGEERRSDGDLVEGRHIDEGHL